MLNFIEKHLKIMLKVLCNERGGLQIEDGTGKGFRVGITAENQLLTQAETHELQHHISLINGQVYQAIGTHDLSGAGTKTILHIKNNDPLRNLIVSYMRIQFPGGDGTIDGNTYFQAGFGTVYSSGGTEVIPENMNEKSGNEASVVVYGNAPTMTGTLREFDRWYADKSMMVFNKHGSLILGLSDTLEWRLITDQTTGFIYVRVTMMMLDKEA